MYVPQKHRGIMKPTGYTEMDPRFEPEDPVRWSHRVTEVRGPLTVMTDSVVRRSRDLALLRGGRVERKSRS